MKANDMERIAVYLPWFLPWTGGIQTAALEIMRNLRQFHFEVVTNEYPHTARKDAMEDHMTVMRFPPMDFRTSRHLTFVPRKVRTLSNGVLEYLRSKKKKEYLRKADFDMLFLLRLEEVDFHRLAFGLESDYLKKMFFEMLDFSEFGSAVLYRDHSRFAQWQPGDVVGDFLLREIPHIQCIEIDGYEKAREFVQDEGLPTKLYHLPNSVDTSHFCYKSPTKSKVLRIGYAARLDREGTDLLLRFTSEIPDGVELRVAGLAPKDVERRFERLSRSPRVKFLGSTSYEDMPGFYSGIDVLLNTLPLRGIGRVTLESMSCGRPVMMARKGNRYPIIDGETGLLFDYDLQDLLDLVGRVAEEKEELLEMGREARRVVEKEFSHEVIMPRQASIFSSIISG